MTPTVGRIVHFHTRFFKDQNLTESEPAIITRVWSDTCVNLRIFSDSTPHNDEFRTSVSQGDLIGQWNWPPRTEEKPAATPPTTPTLVVK